MSDVIAQVIRSLEPLAREALMAELQTAGGVDRRYDAALQAHEARWPGLPAEAEARWFVERLALLLTASVLLRHAPGAVADGFVATRIAVITGENAAIRSEGEPTMPAAISGPNAVGSTSARRS